MNAHLHQQFNKRLKTIYGDALTDAQVRKFTALLQMHNDPSRKTKNLWTEQDVVLITYGDSVLKEGERPLTTLRKFLNTYLRDTISCVHILPFFPYSSDDGFSVIDYKQVDPRLGTWREVAALTNGYSLMFDLVVNHISSKSRWFRNYLAGRSPEKDFFIEADPQTDLSRVVRPRSLPLLSEYKTAHGSKHLWTTFSRDQVDLNFRNPEVLFRMLSILMEYLARGARIIRMDAIAFLWKEPGTNCLHHANTHEVVKLFRDAADLTYPGTIILTETNVPNQENLSYLGHQDEAHMVYQFSMPPLVLHALNAGNTTYLNHWAASLPKTQPATTFFNFTASHDGIGVRPLEGLLPERELTELLACMQRFGGRVSTRRNSNGTDSPYEINITYFDALKGTSHGADDFQEQRFLCSQAIMLAMKGIPGIYLHSLMATQNYQTGVHRTGRARSINRRKWQLSTLQYLLKRNTPTRRVFLAYKQLIRIRRRQPAFHPDGEQKMLDCGTACFGFQRSYKKQHLFIFANLTDQKQWLDVKSETSGAVFTDLIHGERVLADQLLLLPYQVVWLRPITRNTKP